MQGANIFRIKFRILITKNVIISMNWKQFLKPDIRKSFPFVLIFIIFSCIYPICTFRCDVLLSYYVTVLIVLITSLNWPLSVNDFVIYSFYTILFLIVSYLLSCVIIWLYDKLGKKKK